MLHEQYSVFHRIISGHCFIVCTTQTRFDKKSQNFQAKKWEYLILLYFFLGVQCNLDFKVPFLPALNYTHIHTHIHTPHTHIHTQSYSHTHIHTQTHNHTHTCKTLLTRLIPLGISQILIANLYTHTQTHTH